MPRVADHPAPIKLSTQTDLRHADESRVQVEGFLDLTDEATQPPQAGYLEESIPHETATNQFTQILGERREEADKVSNARPRNLEHAKEAGCGRFFDACAVERMRSQIRQQHLMAS